MAVPLCYLLIGKSMKSYIYKIQNKVNNKVYIGFTVNPERRYYNHFKGSIKDSKKRLYCSMNKHGRENFTFEIIYCSHDYDHTLNVMENYFITEYDSLNSGYNSVPGGVSKGFNYSTNKGKVSITKNNTQKYIKKEDLLDFINDGWVLGSSPNKGKLISEAKKKQNKRDVVPCIEIITGNFVNLTSEEYQKAKVLGTHIAKNSGMKNSEETKRKKSDSMKGIPKSDSHKRKLSESVKKQHRIMVSSLYNKKQYDIGNFSIHLRVMNKNNIPFTYFSPDIPT